MKPGHVRRVILTAALLAALPASAPAQSQPRDPRIALTAIAGRESVAVDGGEGTFTIGGAAIRLRLLRVLSLEAELTTGTGEATDSYEGVFTSLGKPGDSIAELERLGVVLRRDRTWTPGTGTAFSVVLHAPSTQRVGLSLAVGLGGRELKGIDTKTLIRLPEGWPETRSTGAGTVTYSRSRGGPFVTLSMPINVTNRLLVVPEVRAQGTIGDEDFTATSLRLRAGWRF